MSSTARSTEPLKRNRMKQELMEATERQVWTAPAERSGDGAFARGQETLLVSPLSCVKKRCRVGLATAVQKARSCLRILSVFSVTSCSSLKTS